MRYPYPIANTLCPSVAALRASPAWERALGALRRALDAARTRRAERRRAREAARALLACDERVLRDMGLSRPEVLAVIYGPRGAAGGR